MFFYLTYEGSVDIDEVADPAMRASILAQINYFGQTPRQLFQKPHGKRKAAHVAPPVHALKHYDLLVAQELKDAASGKGAISQVGAARNSHESRETKSCPCLLKRRLLRLADCRCLGMLHSFLL